MVLDLSFEEEALGIKKFFADNSCIGAMVVSLRRCLMFRDGNVVLNVSQQINFSKSFVEPIGYEVLLSVVFFEV